MQFIFGGVAIAIAVMASSLAVLFDTEDAVLYFEPITGATQSHKGLSLGLYVESREPLNVVSGTIVFPSKSVSIEVVKSDESFVDVWLMEPRVDQKKGEITFAGGTSKRTGLNDRGKLFDLFVATTSTSSAEITIKNVEVYGSDGQGTLLSAGGRTYTLAEESKALSAGTSSGGGSYTLTEIADRSDLNGDGSVTIGDLSVLFYGMLQKYDSKYDINNDGTVGISDFSSLLSVLR